MQEVKLRFYVGEDRILHLNLPSEFKKVEVDVTVTVQAVKEVAETRYNAWGKPVTQQSITQAIDRIRHLQKRVALDKSTIREMRDEGRRL